MRKFFLSVLVIMPLLNTAYAFSENFYLTSKPDVEKLIPSALSDTISVGESKAFYVDILPRGSNDEIYWQIDTPLATLSPNGTKCTLKAVSAGETVIHAATESGVSCSIQIKIQEQKPQILLESKDIANSGESVIIKAHPSTDTAVSWDVEGVEPTRISFGGNMCKIKPKKAGLVKVSASIGDTTVSKTLEILPSKNGEFDLDSLSLFLAGCGVILLLIVLIYGRGYEKKH